MGIHLIGFIEVQHALFDELEDCELGGESGEASAPTEPQALVQRVLIKTSRLTQVMNFVIENISKAAHGHQ